MFIFAYLVALPCCTVDSSSLPTGGGRVLCWMSGLNTSYFNYKIKPTDLYGCHTWELRLDLRVEITADSRGTNSECLHPDPVSYFTRSPLLLYDKLLIGDSLLETPVGKVATATYERSRWGNFIVLFEGVFWGHRGFEYLEHSNWTICSLLSQFCSGTFPTFTHSYWGAILITPEG